MKKISALLVIIILSAAVILAGCGSKKSKEDTNKKDNSDGKFTSRQIDGPKSGDTIVTLHVKNFGDISVVLFPEAAPKAVENFVKHAEDGYFDNMIFHRVIENFMIQSGDPTGTGTGGESIWGKDFENEIDDSFLTIKGALCMANAGADTNGSQFFIITSDSCNEEYLDACSDEQKTRYKKFGGATWLHGQYTVFGQVYEGHDVAEKISQVKTASGADKPVEDVIIEGVSVSTYK